MTDADSEFSDGHDVGKGLRDVTLRIRATESEVGAVAGDRDVDGAGDVRQGGGEGRVALCVRFALVVALALEAVEATREVDLDVLGAARGLGTVTGARRITERADVLSGAAVTDLQVDPVRPLAGGVGLGQLGVVGVDVLGVPVCRGVTVGGLVFLAILPAVSTESAATASALMRGPHTPTRPSLATVFSPA